MGQAPLTHPDTRPDRNAAERAELWAWAIKQAVSLRLDRDASRTVPYQLHDSDGDDAIEPDSESTRDVIGGLPFTRPFAQGLDRDRGFFDPSHPLIAALARMSRDDRRREVVSAIVRGETDPEALRRHMGLEPFTFDVLRLHGLRELRSYVEPEAEAPPGTTPTPAVDGNPVRVHPVDANTKRAGNPHRTNAPIARRRAVFAPSGCACADVRCEHRGSTR